MEQPVKILIVEDEMIIAANISLQLSALGYEVTGIIPRGEEALEHVKQNKPDIVLMDIQLKGELDGIDTARLMQQKQDIPIIYLTANADDTNFAKAKDTHPFAFISKPFKKLDLQRAIELTISHIQTKVGSVSEQKNSPFILSNCIFVRNHEKMVKVPIENILYIEAERNYCRIHTKNKEYLLVITLKDLDEKLPPKHFLRIHRSFIVNIAQIDELATSHLVIAKKAVPISKPLKEELLKRLQTI
ncbi:MAG: DNA-binding response regulator [Flavobacteriaceae bacterium CG_4_8_14_3_um_filter_34_10]|nr:response regulator transcription factor [Flavobacteriia bacterium]PIQ17574.1 MAG: DNA-binding response regulator [Flavobacteriaceae bacterium CG18_big_fil_WC_8_21_14_2_50_34_36]PIV51602.1 MAG: DNA-binding response regulator [Flavobacteriaceae bacterium CG02_land_8_20_14_3_00_34_13]PIX09035.1 MAG: DNA-binding response regulator [Flavobacteriaceae bacterium CG_4_8_14_3_um_filter_34_10]PIZ08045.1 MAG: DNA-binding response regulator [Flavobacteriaceae bacterium CG_4_10_14_0_8_um_filter_34_31]